MYTQLQNYVSCCWYGAAIYINEHSITKAVEEAPLAGNIDDPEGSLDALMQVTASTVYPRSLDPFYIVSYCIKWVKTSKTCCMYTAVLL